MTQTLTTERMEEIAKLATRLHHISGCAAVTSSGETVMHHTHVDEILSALHDVTAELLANREAQTQLVKIVERLNISGYEINDGPVDSSNASDAIEIVFGQLNDAVWMMDTAPPAPAVPDKITPAQAQKMLPSKDYVMNEDELNVAADMWNACRAAMLAAALEGGN